MSKLLTVLGVGVSGTALSLGGAYMLGAFNKKHNFDIPVSLEDFRKDLGKEAVSNFFSGVEGGEANEGESWAKNKPSSDFLTKDTSSPAESRLVVNWEKFKCSPDDNGKQWGRIRWLWTLVGKDKGLVIYVSAKPSSSSDSKLSAEGVIYALEKEGIKGKIKHHKKTTNDSTLDAFKDKLPSPSDKLKKETNEYWNFLETESIANLCKQGVALEDGTNKPESMFRGAWVWKKGEDTSTETPLDWSSDGEKWVESVYGSLDPKVKDLVSSLKGTWDKEYLEQTPLKQKTTTVQPTT